MNLHLTSRHGNLDMEDETMIKAAIERFTHYFDHINRVDVVCDNVNPKSCEISVKVNGHTLVTRHESDDMKRAIHDATEKMIRQLRKTKTRNQFDRVSLRA